MTEWLLRAITLFLIKSISYISDYSERIFDALALQTREE
jgi:hypothetical protein